MNTLRLIMPSRLSAGEKRTSLLVLAVYIVGIAGFSVPGARGIFTRLIPAVIILSFAASLAYHQHRFDLKTVMVFFFIATLAWFIEAAGVSSGLIFGSYSYGPGLGIKFFDTPVIIGLNWLLLVYGTAGITELYLRKPWMKAVSGTAIMVLYDIFLEIVAPKLEMWQFDAGRATMKNYIAWFIIALSFHSLLQLTGIRVQNRLAPVIFIVQFLFLVLLSLIFTVAP